MLIKKPAFTLTAAFTLALGIGANTAIFSAVNAVLLKSMPFYQPDRLVLVWGSKPSEGSDRGQVSFTEIYDLKTQNHVFEEITNYNSWQPTLSGMGDPEPISGMRVGDGYFSLMKSTPILGRVFLPEEKEQGKDAVVVISHGFWQRRFGGDPNVVGKTLTLNQRTYAVIGVMPADFSSLPSTLIGGQAEIYRPIAELHADNLRGNRHLRSIARLKPGISIAQAQAEIDVIARQLEQQFPENHKGIGYRLVTIGEDTVKNVRSTLLLMLGAVAFVLLIACANVGNLLLSRSSVRRKEIAVRASLGASRGRLVRQMLTESLLLATIGGVLGIVLALIGIEAMRSLSVQVSPLLSVVAIDLRVLTFAILITLATGVVFGLAPALHGTKLDLNQALRDGGKGSGSGSGQNRLRGLLVITEFSMALILLIGAGLIIKSIVRLREVNPGFDPRNMATLTVNLSPKEYPDSKDWTNAYNKVLDRVKQLPGVQSAGLTDVLPLSGGFDGRGLVVEGQPVPVGDEPSADMYIVTPDYLSTMSIPVLKGRPLNERDKDGVTLVTLVSEGMAKQFWPNQEPIGKRIRLDGKTSPWLTVVGVVSDVRHYALDKTPPMQFYIAQAQFPNDGMSMVVRTTSDPTPMLDVIKREVRTVDKEMFISDLVTMDQLVSDSISLRRFSMRLLGLFALTAMILASIGIYGVISYSVSQRYQEIGVRIALGATRKNVLGLIVTKGMILVAIGTVIGLAGAYILTTAMSTLLYNVSPSDPFTFVAVAGLLAVVAVFACIIPARRATKIDPITALRYE